VKLLLDECVDRRLAGDIVGHEVRTVPQMGWAGKHNGELLSLAADEFDVFITVDRNLSKQHDVAKFVLAIVVLVARSNRLVDLQPLVPSLLAKLADIKPGEAVEVG
jgi:Domain of unknown function (DUF5615)